MTHSLLHTFRGSRAAFTATIFAVLSAVLAACGGGDGPAAPAKVATVDISPMNSSKLPGETVQLTVTARDAGGNILAGRAVAWVSSSAAVATVTNAGLVTTVSPGTAAITAAIEGITATANFTVTQPPVATIAIAPPAPTVFANRTTQLLATLKDAAGATLTGRTTTWASASPTIATVSESGLVTGVAVGTSVITATSEGKSATVTVTVSLNPCLPVPENEMTVGQTRSGVLATTDCPFIDANSGPDGTYVDLYFFDVDVPSPIQIDMVSAVFDTYLFLDGFNGTTFVSITQDDNSGEGNNARITRQLQPATYLVEANSTVNPPGFGEYTLSVMLQGAAIALDHGSTLSLRRAHLSAGQWAQLQRARAERLSPFRARTH